MAERFAESGVRVDTTGNPWTEPPADVLKIGIGYAARFLKDLEDYGRTSCSRLKVVLVGLANAGKTSVAVRLEGRARSESLPTAEQRTVGVEIRDIQLGPGSGNAALDLKLWDFAGQRAYYDTHQVTRCLVYHLDAPHVTPLVKTSVCLKRAKYAVFGCYPLMCSCVEDIGVGS